MKVLFQNLTSLYDAELYSNVVLVADMFLNVIETSGYAENPDFKLYALFYLADSLFQLGRCRRAGHHFKEALVYRQTHKSKRGKKFGNLFRITEHELKYRVALCNVKLGEFEEAFKMLESIPTRFRSAKANMELAKLYEYSGKKYDAIDVYRDILKEYPLSLEVIESLLKLGVLHTEVTAILSASQLAPYEWLNLWIKAYGALRSCDFETSITAYNLILNHPSPLKNYPIAMFYLAETYYLMGDYTKANFYANETLSRDQYCERYFGVMAAIYSATNNIEALEKMVPANCMQEPCCEVYTAFAYFLYRKRSYNNAAFIVQKACLLNPKNCEAVLAKACILFELKKYKECTLHFREAFNMNPKRYETVRGLVSIYVAQSRIKDAVVIALNYIKLDNNSSRSWTLYAKTLLHEANGEIKARNAAEKALKINEYNREAALLLGQFSMQMQPTINLVEILLKQIERDPYPTTHLLLANIYRDRGDDENASHHYHETLRLQPNNLHAEEGLASMDRNDNEEGGDHEFVGPRRPRPRETRPFYFNSSSESETDVFYTMGANTTSDDSDS